MLEQVHKHIRSELQQNTRTDIIFIIAAIFLNLLALGINAATAERSQEDTSLLIVMFIVLILEIVLIAANINFDLASFFGESEKVVAGYTVPLGDIKIVGPICYSYFIHNTFCEDPRPLY